MCQHVTTYWLKWVKCGKVPTVAVIYGFESLDSGIVLAVYVKERLPKNFESLSTETEGS